MNNVEETLYYFKEMGFTEYEAKVYLSLLSLHPASAYTISRHSGVPHSRVYDVTRRLIKRGVAISSGTKPELFSPLSPKNLLEKLRRDYNKFTEELEKRLKQRNFVSDFDPVWNLPNPEEALKTTAGLIENAELAVYIGLWEEELEVLKEPLRRAHTKGARVVILLYGTTQLDFGEVYFHSTENMPVVGELGRTLDCVVDSTLCVTGTLGGTYPCQVVWTKNRGLVQSIESYICHDLYLAEVHRHFGRQLTELYGPNLVKLRRKFQ